jgi:hypothetical protein
MHHSRNYFFFFVLLLVLSLQPLSLYGEEYQGHKSAGVKGPGSEQTPVYPPMPVPGKKVAIGSDRYIIYGFDKKTSAGDLLCGCEIRPGLVVPVDGHTYFVR